MEEREEGPYFFGDLVRGYRKRLDLTQSALATLVSCAEVTIRKIEANTMRPSPEMAERLAIYLEIPIADRSAFVEAAREKRGAFRLSFPRNDITIKPRTLPAPAPISEVSPYVGLLTFQE